MHEPVTINPSGATQDQFIAGGASGLLERIILANNEELEVLDYQLIRSVKTGNLDDVYRRLREIVVHAIRGQPMVDKVKEIRRIERVFGLLVQLCRESAVFVDQMEAQDKTVPNAAEIR